MRQMNGMMQEGAHAAAAGALPQGATYVSHSSSYSSDGRRSQTTTRAAGGVSKLLYFY